MKLKNIIASIVALTLVVSCGTTKSDRDIRTAAGAVAGGVVGSTVGGGRGKSLAVVAGSLLGAFIGSQVATSIQKTDVTYADELSQKVLEFNPIGRSSEWVNPDTSHKGTLTPTKTIRISDGTYCREFTQTVTIAGETQQAFGEACRAPDGTWRVRQQ